MRVNKNSTTNETQKRTTIKTICSNRFADLFNHNKKMMTVGAYRIIDMGLI